MTKRHLDGFVCSLFLFGACGDQPPPAAMPPVGTVEGGLSAGGIGETCATPGPSEDCNRDQGLICVARSEGRSPACACDEAQEFDYTAQHCVDAAIGQRPGDACGPGGEGDFPWGKCDENRGLRCVPAPAIQVDAPPTCEWPRGAELFGRGAGVHRRSHRRTSW